MKNFLLLVFLAMINFTSSCSQGQPVKEERKLTGFKSFELSVSATVNLQQGPFKFEIEGTNSDLQLIATEVVGDRLIIKTKRTFANIGKVNIYITMPEIEGIEIDGSGTIIAPSAIKVGSLKTEISGSGDIRFTELTADILKIDISGSGKFETSGKQKGNQLDIDISGSGRITAKNHEFKKVKIEVSGSGTAEVWATENLECDLSGSGKVQYRGNPKINSDISGSGSLRAID